MDIKRWFRRHFKWKRCLHCGYKDMYEWRGQTYECKRCNKSYTKRDLKSV